MKKVVIAGGGVLGTQIAFQTAYNIVLQYQKVPGVLSPLLRRMMMPYTGNGRDVADPWCTWNFEVTFQDILAGCEAMLRLYI